MFILISAGLLSCIIIYFLIQKYHRKPFIKACGQSDWVFESEDRKDIYVLISAKTHKQGRRPTVKFLELNSPFSSKFIEPVIDENGDVKFINPQKHFIPRPPKEFKVKIVAG